jgi:hypothetical protein
MRSLALGIAIVIPIAAFGVEAADLTYPPPLVELQYGAAPPPVGAPPPVIVIPGRPVPQYNGALVPPRVVGSSPYGVAPPVAPRVGIGSPAACSLVWRCGDRGCGWEPGCTSHPERYSGPYQSPSPQVYSGPEAPPTHEPYAEPSAPPVYSGPNGPNASERSPYRP